jgi:hypothetical protein
VTAQLRALHDARAVATYSVAQRFLRARAPFQLGPIDAAACTAFTQSWVAHPQRWPSWDWHALSAKYYRHHYARLDLAVWSGPTLCGLVLGRFSRAETVLQLNFIEGAPGPHPLRGDVLNLGVTFGEILGEAYGAKVLRVTCPAPHVVAALAQKGYRDVAPSKISPYYHFCERQLP